MKWSNKRPRTIRRSEWSTAPAPRQEDIKIAQRWCKENGSDGLFYNHYTNTRWWFENEQDAFLFSLRWA